MPPPDLAGPPPAPEPEVRAVVYASCRTFGRPPSVAETSTLLGRRDEDVREAFRRLADARVLVLQPDGEILMANPFSAVPTPFPVQAGGVSSYGNCIWDALGIAATLRRDATISTSCACCGAQIGVEIADASVRSGGERIHFGVPAHHWWDNIVFT